jgi:serine/threonine protein kinase
MASTAPLQKIKGYELRHQIGAGGFGAVYRAFQPVVERDVAMKVILPEYANQPAFIRNFESEARLVARLEHPHIVPLFDFWRDPNGAYIVMRWIKGGSLRDKMDDGGVPMDLDAVGHILDQVTSALSTAHRSQVIHRDIKPENILLDEDGNAYVTDFGIARQMGTDPDTEDDHDSISGSILYMPPETIQSQTPSPQSDMYSLGIMLYELVTGQYPFAYESPTQVIMKHLMDELPSVIDVIDTLPEDVDEIIRRATAKQPDERYDDIRQMAIDFRRMLNQGGSAIPLDFSYDDLQNPYKGLRAFDEADSVDFFGREALINELSEALAASDFLAVVGPSGSGKSSVVRAGLVPRLRRDGLEGYDQWFIADMMPGTEPIQALEAALQGVAAIDTRDLSDRLANTPNGLLWAAEQILTAPEDRLLLVIDQFEEVFTLVTDEAKREHSCA